MTQSILDFDLDYFFYPPVVYPPWASWFASHGIPEHRRRARNKRLRFWMTRGRLEKRLMDLGVPPLTMRCTFEDHQQALPFWLYLVEKGHIQAPFTVYHFDAHSDLYLAPSEEQDKHFEAGKRKFEAGERIDEIAHEANYLWWAIYLGLVDRIVWIVPEPQFCLDRNLDYNERYCRPPRESERSKALEDEANDHWAEWIVNKVIGRKSESRAAWQRYRDLCTQAVAERYQAGLVCKRWGKEVALEVTTLERLTAIENPIAVDLCRSPDYTPAKADRFFERLFTLFD